MLLLDDLYLREKTITVKPFIKWAGGKGQLLSQIRNLYPSELGKSITKYAEPFVGGGAVLFDILSRYPLEEVYISDINLALINTYRVIREKVEQLINDLRRLQNQYLPLEAAERNTIYYQIRERFNEFQHHNETLNIERATYFIFLNKTCFNGLYRVNRKNLFNVPIGSYKTPVICDEDNLRKISKLLEGVEIVCGDYRESARFIDQKTFVYFDPPYRPLNFSSNFTSYTNEGFDDRAQIELAEYVQYLDQQGASIIVSNSDPKNTDENDNFFDEIYSRQKINRVSATRMINSNANSRGKINELLISNIN